MNFTAIGMTLSIMFWTQPHFAAGNPVWPSLQASDLNKRKIELPGGLAGELNVLLVAFQREQQKDVDTWLPLLPAVVWLAAGIVACAVLYVALLPCVRRLNRKVQLSPKRVPKS